MSSPRLRARLPRADALIIGVEAIFEALVEHAIAGEEALQQEGLEEPGGMREMPFGRARVVHGLHDLILVAQGRGKLGRQRARGQQAIAQARLISVFGLMSATTTLWRFIIHSLGSGCRCNGEKPGFAEPTRRTHRNARFTSLFRHAEWLSMHNSVRQN